MTNPPAILNKTLARIAALALALPIPLALADNAPTPLAAKGVLIVSVDEARVLVGKNDFFDMRSPVNYGRGHIKGAIALPYDLKSENNEGFDAAKDRFDMAKLPANKAAPIVFYSDGPTGWKSYKAAISAARSGYSNVKWMREGTAGWSAKGLPLE